MHDDDTRAPGARPPADPVTSVVPPPPLPGPPTRILPAPGLDPSIRAEFLRAMRRSDRTLANSQPPSASVLEDVFINTFGQIWGADGALVRPHPVPLREASARAMATAPEADDVAFARGGVIHRNFFHWTTEALPSLSRYLDAEVAPMPIGISVEASHFVAESLAIAARRQVAIVPVGDALRVRRLHIVPCTRWALAYRETHAAMFERMIARATATVAPAAGPLRLYISRGDSGLRPIANEPDLCAALERRGFRVVEMGGLPLVEQIALIRRARRIVAPHGAGLSHLIFAQPGCRVLEIFPASIGTRPARIAMTRISRVFGHRHALWLETGEGVDEGWNVSLDPLLAHLDGA